MRTKYRFSNYAGTVLRTLSAD